ncbi:DUF551 domain-containing protein [Klebsiella aerogenes]
MRHIFTPTGMINISDLQAVFDRVEVVLSSMESEHVVTITDAMAYAFHHALTDGPLGDDDVEDIKTGLRAAFATVTIKQPEPVVPVEATIDNKPNSSYEWRKGWNACRAAMLQAGDAVRDLSTPVDPQVAEYEQNVMQAGNSPVIPDTWIPVSERMPDDSSDVLCTAEFDGPGDWRKKVGYWHEGKWVVYGASWTPTHWMPLPAAPQEVKGE